MRKRLESAAFEHLPDASVVVDPSGRILAANRKARSFGRARDCRALNGCRLRPCDCPLRLRRSLRRDIPVCGGRWNAESIQWYREPGTGRALAVMSWRGRTRERRLRDRARRDGMTGLLNRDAFWEAAAARWRRRASGAAFVMLDLDGLKAVNDALGHAAGDDLIARFGKALRSAARRRDLCGRLGGDEFAVYCPASGRAEADAFVARLRAALKDGAVSAGVAAGTRTTLRRLCAAADRDLYRDKRRRKMAVSLLT